MKKEINIEIDQDDFKDLLDYDYIIDKVSDGIDIDQIASEVSDNMDWRDIASNIEDYLDINDKVYDALSDTNYLTVDDLENLMTQYSPDSGCRTARYARQIIDDTMSHYIETASTSLRNGDRIVDPVAASIVELVKLIIGDSNSTKTTDENTAVTVVDENTNQPQTNGDNKVSLTYDELSKLFSNFADKNRYYVGVSFPLNWDNIFPSMIAEAAESVSPSVHLSITEIIENARG